MMKKGNAIKPDFIVTDNAYILEKTDNLEEYSSDFYGNNIKNAIYYINATKRHALAHNIPIVLVDRKYYS